MSDTDLKVGNRIFVGPLRKEDKTAYEHILSLNEDIKHLPQLLEIGIIVEKYKDKDACLIDFGTYRFVLPVEMLSPMVSDDAYFELLEELNFMYHDLLSDIVYLRPRHMGKETFMKRIKEGVSFNDTAITALTVKTIRQLLAFFIDTSEICSISINGKNFTVGTVKIMWNYVQKN